MTLCPHRAIEFARRSSAHRPTAKHWKISGGDPRSTPQTANVIYNATCRLRKQIDTPPHQAAIALSRPAALEHLSEGIISIHLTRASRFHEIFTIVLNTTHASTQQKPTSCIKRVPRQSTINPMTNRPRSHTKIAYAIQTAGS